jgi:SAM-dependent methyltransferase
VAARDLEALASAATVARFRVAVRPLSGLCGVDAVRRAIDERAREPDLRALRQRAVAKVLLGLGRDLRACTVHESSPSLGSWQFLRRVAGRAVGSYFFDGEKRVRVGMFHAVDLQAQPFAAGTFDVVVTQDVFEHVPEPMRAFAEIHRTLRRDGVHVFTVPRRRDCETRARARLVDERLELLAAAEYHRNPIDQRGSLVVTDWGRDLETILGRDLGVRCRATVVHAPELGIDVPIEVFVAERDAGSPVVGA